MQQQQLNPADVTRAAEVLAVLRDEVGKAVLGQRQVVDQTLVALVASGHVLIEGVPGLGKTLSRARWRRRSRSSARASSSPPT